jgi:hypothetical protein
MAGMRAVRIGEKCPLLGEQLGVEGIERLSGSMQYF